MNTWLMRSTSRRIAPIPRATLKSVAAPLSSLVSHRFASAVSRQRTQIFGNLKMLSRVAVLSLGVFASTATQMQWVALDADKYPLGEDSFEGLFYYFCSTSVKHYKHHRVWILAAQCNDGTRAGYYWRPAAPGAVPLWLVFLEGGSSVRFLPREGWRLRRRSIRRRRLVLQPEHLRGSLRRSDFVEGLPSDRRLLWNLQLVGSAPA